jgi:hypothetical protein
VAFVSLTNMPQESVKQFVKQFSIPWPCGYAVTNQTIANFGAYTDARQVPGYEVTPTLYVMGSNGRILWSDRQTRLLHKDPAPLLQELEREIERALTVRSDAESK